TAAHEAVGPEQRRATWGDYVFRNRAMHQLMMTQTTFFHMTPATVREGVDQVQIDAAIAELFDRERVSYVDAPLAPGAAQLPVVVMTHGDAGSRYNMSTVCEYLAAHGYLVIAADHTGNSPFAMSGSDPALDFQSGDPAFIAEMAPVMAEFNDHGAYGTLETFGQSYTPLSAGRDSPQFQVNLDASLLQRLNDLRAVLAELDKMQDEGKFADRLALDRIGLIGRSFGGATTLVGLGLEPRFTAGFAVVPPSYVDVRGMMPAELLAPAGQESVLLSAADFFPLADIRKPMFLLSGAEDNLIIGLADATAELTGTATSSPDNPLPGLRATYEASAAPVVWGMLADATHSTLGVSAGYWWPELKPNSKKRYFKPDETFQMLSPNIAQTMQREKAMAFFDLFIRGDESARERILDPSWSSVGLQLETRNF
ncbi:MAG: dienelactone hydrolase, partial [Halieaceae bacterium]